MISVLGALGMLPRPLRSRGLFFCVRAARAAARHGAVVHTAACCAAALTQNWGINNVKGHFEASDMRETELAPHNISDGSALVRAPSQHLALQAATTLLSRTVLHSTLALAPWHPRTPRVFTVARWESHLAYLEAGRGRQGRYHWHCDPRYASMRRRPTAPQAWCTAASH